MEMEFVEPGAGFSEDWLGFRRSAQKRMSGRHYAQCKYCGQTMDGRLPGLRKHKINCELFGGEELNATYYEEQDPIENSQHYEAEEVIQEDVKVAIPKRKITAPPRKSIPSTRIITPQGVQRITSHNFDFTMPQAISVAPSTPLPTTQGTGSPTAPPTKRSRFEDISRVWERKLSELPLSQALQLEKTINDLLYDAVVGNIQQMEQQQHQHQQRNVIKVDINTAASDHE